MDRKQIVACVIVGLWVSGGLGCSRDRPITVGSKNFTEQVILGEIVAQHLEHRLGRTVDRKLNLGGTLLVHQALVKGEIDLYPEYTGTALTTILGLRPTRDSAASMGTVRQEYERRFGVEWMEPLGFNNTFAMVIREEVARIRKVATLSEAARSAPSWKLGVGYEFQQRPDGLVGLLETYDLSLVGSPITMDLGLLYKALDQRQVDMIAASATDGLLSVLDVRVLRDDRGYFPAYHGALAVRSDTLKQNPPVRQALAELTGRFTDDTMRRLNYQVDGEHRPVREVAEQFLRDAGLLG
jgi:glycine betaine/choline ABC-type transport system substrate-binding protein